MSRFHHALEELNRGPRDLMEDRLHAYLPFLQPIIDANMGKMSVDLGCGRGEWLELASEKGLEIHGIDSDPEMIETARAFGLSVSEEDAIKYMVNQPDASLAVVSAFNLVEYISFLELQKLIEESCRTLIPGGLMILETPNPENISVATNSFHLDPMRIRPIPPMLLSLLFELSGFEPIKIVRLQEPTGLHPGEDVKLFDVIHGVNPEYAIVGQKPGNDKLTAALKGAFSAECGIDLSSLLKRYDERSDTTAKRLGNAEEKIEAFESTNNVTQIRLGQLEHDAKATIQQLDYLIKRSLWEKLLFTMDGKPKWILRRILFHKSGRPREEFKAAVMHKDGRARRPFKLWIESQEYHVQQRGVQRDGRKAPLGRAELASVRMMTALSTSQRPEPGQSVIFLKVEHDT